MDPANRLRSCCGSWIFTACALPSFNVAPTFAGCPTSLARWRMPDMKSRIIPSRTSPYGCEDASLFGVRWPGLREAQRRLGLTGVMWSTIGVDWRLPIQNVVARLLRGAGNGAIFCLHDGRVLERRPDIGVTLRSIEQVLPILIQNGFHFEKVSEIICPTTN